LLVFVNRLVQLIINLAKQILNNLTHPIRPQKQQRQINPLQN